MSPRKQQDKETEAQRIAQILDGAAIVFAEKGFHKATTKDVAKAAQMAEGSIYNYFGSKRDLLIGLLQRLGNMSSLDTIQPDELHDLTTYYIEDARARLQAFQQERKVWKALLPEILVDEELRALFLVGLNQQYLHYVEPYLRSQIARGELAPIENVPLTARVMQSLPLGLFLQALLGDPVLDAEWDALPALMANLVYNGLKHQSKEEKS